MKKRAFLISFMTGALVLFPIALYGQERGGGSSALVPPPRPYAEQITSNSTPVAQPLVPEGVFAVELVKALKIGQAQNEAEAEGMLSAVGIEPRNGWIADYPVTPDIIGEIQESVATAAKAKKFRMGKDQAQKAMEDLVANLGLNVMPGPSSPSAQAAPGGGTTNTTIYKFIDKSGVVHFTDQYESIPMEYQDQIRTIREEAQSQYSVGPAEEAEPGENNYTATPNPEVINNYYYSSGPPVVTYYAPPQPYYYMYVWVPYPFWCSRVFFPGFFILHDFHRTIYVHRRMFVVTNHVVNARTKTVFRVDPVTRNPGGRVAVTRVSSPKLFSTSSAQAGARAIVTLNQQGAQSAKGAASPGIRNHPSSISLSGARQQVRSNPGANPSGAKASTLNRGANPNPAGTSSSAVPGMPPLRPSIIEKQNEANLQKSWPREVRPFRQPSTSNETSVTSPATTGRSSNRPDPSAIMRSPRVEQRASVMPGNIGTRVPSTSQSRIITAPTAKGSGSPGGSSGKSGGSIGHGSFR